MVPSTPVPPPRFVVQCAKGKGWKTLVVDENQAAAERAFHEVVKVKPKGFFRLIRLDDKPDAEVEGQEFTWKLLTLHDPRKGPETGFTGAVSVAAATRDASRHRVRQPIGRAPSRQSPGQSRSDRVRIPFRLYATALVMGVVLAVLAYLRYGSS